LKIIFFFIKNTQDKQQRMSLQQKCLLKSMAAVQSQSLSARTTNISIRGKTMCSKNNIISKDRVGVSKLNNVKIKFIRVAI
jgi:type IV secretory pathway protease TraF